MSIGEFVETEESSEQPVSVEVAPTDNPLGSPETAIASTLIPWDRDDVRALYFGYRSSGLSVKETLNMIERTKSWLSEQRKDPTFVALEFKIPEFRRELSKEYIELEFIRNFRLVLKKDAEVLRKSLFSPTLMSKSDCDYLIKLRSQYTPEQIQVLETVIQGKGGFDFSKFIMENQQAFVQFSRTDTVTVGGKGGKQE